MLSQISSILSLERERLVFSVIEGIIIITFFIGGLYLFQFKEIQLARADFIVIVLGSIIAIYAAAILFSGAQISQDRPILRVALYICAGFLVGEVLLVIRWMFLSF